MKVAVVILNWNGLDWLKKFIPNVVEHSREDATVIVADNASTDTSVAWLKANFPEVQIVQNVVNHGFAGGYNVALKNVEAEYYMILNSDVEVTPDWLKPLLQQMDADPFLAAVMPKVRSWHHRNQFEHAGAAGGFIDKNGYPFCRGRMFDHVEVDNGQYDTPTDIAWTTGAAMLMRSKCYHDQSGFDADFFAHMEEIDLCWRLKNQGYRFMCEPASVVYHVGGGALPYNSPRKTYLNFRNNLFMITKNYRSGFLFPKIVNRMFLDGVAGMKFLFSGQFSHFWSVIKGHFSYYGKLRTTLKKRKVLKANLAEKPNLSGHYKRNLLWQFFAKKKKEFKSLEPKDFKH